jgi:hypothetical protein
MLWNMPTIATCQETWKQLFTCVEALNIFLALKNALIMGTCDKTC